MRDKLIKLLKTAHAHYYTEKYNGSNVYEAMAEYILAHGKEFVTDILVGHEWIPVKKRNPYEEAMQFFAEFGEWPEFLVMIKGGFVPKTLFFCPDEWFDSAENTYSVTHWMPLPELP